DRHGQVTPVHVVQVNDVGLQPGKAFVDALTYVGSVAADGRPAPGAVCRVAVDAEFRRQRDLVPSVGEQLGNESLVVAAAVDVGGVDKSNAEVQAAIERGKRFSVVDVTVAGCQCPRAESYCTDREVVAKLRGAAGSCHLVGSLASIHRPI